MISIRKCACAALLLSLLYSTASAALPAPTVPDNLADFTGGIGINTHIEFQLSGSPYFSSGQVTPYTEPLYSNIESALQYLGIDTLRDYLLPSTNSSLMAIYQKLNQDIGAKFDFTTNTSEGYTLQTDIQYDGIVKYYEGLNEPDNDVAGGGTNGINDAEVMQPNIYKVLKDQITYTPQSTYSGVVAGPVTGNTASAAIPVIQFSIGRPTTFYSSGGYASAASVVGSFADFGNAHIYWGTGNPPGSLDNSHTIGAGADFISNFITDGKTMTPNKSVIVTETGYPTVSSDVQSVSEAVQAQYILTDLLDLWSAGAYNTFLYDLVDLEAASAPSPIRTYHYGLFHNDWTTKLAATALHNMMAILADTTANNSSKLSSLAYQVGSGTQAEYTYLTTPDTFGTVFLKQAPNIKSHLFQKHDGTFVLALWNDVRLSDSLQQLDVNVPVTPALLQLGTQARQIQVYDPLTGTQARNLYTKLQGLMVFVPAHPIFVFITI